MLSLPAKESTEEGQGNGDNATGVGRVRPSEREVVLWLEEHDRRPEITSKPSTDAQVLESRVARNLAILRTRNKKDDIPVATREELDRVFPSWRDEVKPRYTKESAISKARDLVEWCRQHHNNKPVRRNFSASLCDDLQGQKAHWPVLRYLQKAASGKSNKQYSDAFMVLDEAFGAQAWRGRAGLMSTAANAQKVQQKRPVAPGLVASGGVEVPTKRGRVSEAHEPQPGPCDSPESEPFWRTGGQPPAIEGSKEGKGPVIREMPTAMRPRPSRGAGGAGGSAPKAWGSSVLIGSGRPRYNLLRYNATEEQDGHEPVEDSPASSQMPVQPVEEGEVVRPITLSNQSAVAPFAILDRVDVADGPFTLACLESADKNAQGSRGRIGFRQETGLERVSSGSDQLVVLGLARPDITQTGLIALSYARANARWLSQRFGGLVLDPRGRHGFHYLLGHDALHSWQDGTSAGAAYAVYMVALFTGRRCADNVHVTGCASISGSIIGVSGYRQKLLAASRDGAKGGQQGRAHAIIPAHSMQGGALMDCVDGGSDDEEVRLPANDLNALRVLAVDDLFTLIELCLSAEESDSGAPPVQRPLFVPGLIAVDVLVPIAPGCGWVCMNVECFMYAGNGQLVVTGGSDAYQHTVRYGVESVKVCWEWGLHTLPGALRIEPRKDPRDTDFDLHVNIVSWEGKPETAPEVSMAAAAGFVTLLLGKPLPPHTAVAAACSLNGVLTGSPMDEQMFLTAKRNNIEIILLHSATHDDTVNFLQQCTDTDKASLAVHYLKDAPGLLPCVAALADPNVQLPELDPEEFKPTTAEEVEAGEGEREGVADQADVEDGAAATAESEP